MVGIPFSESQSRLVPGVIPRYGVRNIGTREISSHNTQHDRMLADATCSGYARSMEYGLVGLLQSPDVSFPFPLCRFALGIVYIV